MSFSIKSCSPRQKFAIEVLIHTLKLGYVFGFAELLPFQWAPVSVFTHLCLPFPGTVLLGERPWGGCHFGPSEHRDQSHLLSSALVGQGRKKTCLCSRSTLARIVLGQCSCCTAALLKTFRPRHKISVVFLLSTLGSEEVVHIVIFGWKRKSHRTLGLRLPFQTLFYDDEMKS